jgi:L-alanine-DL-glutamate epimerase-like enolase superfamily enzyme
LHESGITTCATNQAGSLLPNLDDANQHMGRFLEWDIVSAPGMLPVAGTSPVLTGPGLGFEVDWSGVERAKDAFRRLRSEG